MRPTGVKTVVGCGAVVIALVVGGCGATTSPRVSDVSAEDSSALTDAEIALAADAARQEIAAEDATVTSASATARSGTVETSNTGSRCTSGRILDVRLIGTFPRIVTLGHPTEGSSGADEDFTVRAVLLTVDASSGQTCLIGVRTGDVSPEAGATVLDVG